MIATLMLIRPNTILEENTAFAAAKPGIVLMSAVATLPVMSLVIAMFSPWSMRKVASVTRKLCSPVRISR